MKFLIVWHLFLFLNVGICLGVTLDEIRSDERLTPERFGQYFAEFTYELREDVQEAKVFLKSRSGDCDDFAVLAAELLREKGYSTKLVVVFMAKSIHVVCYVAETKSYLDFNRRGLKECTVASGGALGDIASRVALSFGSPWHCVSEFTFREGKRHFVYTEFPAGKPAQSEKLTAVN